MCVCVCEYRVYHGARCFLRYRVHTNPGGLTHLYRLRLPWCFVIGRTNFIMMDMLESRKWSTNKLEWIIFFFQKNEWTNKCEDVTESSNKILFLFTSWCQARKQRYDCNKECFLEANGDCISTIAFVICGTKFAWWIEWRPKNGLLLPWKI